MKNKALDSDFIVSITRTPDDGKSHRINVVKNEYMKDKQKQQVGGGEPFFKSSVIITLPSKEKQIEEIAWQVFQTKLGLTWKRILTAEEKLSITEKEEYQQYRDIAVGVWEKKQRAFLNKKYPVIEIPADGKSGMWGGAYVLCFVYSKHDGNFVLTGYIREVGAYLKKNYTHYFCNMSMWWNGMHRDVWHFWKDSVVLHSPHRDSKSYKGRERWKWQVRPYVNWDVRTEEAVKDADEKALWFKRLPKRWIPEFDNF